MRTHYPFLAAMILSCSIQAIMAQDKPASSEQPEKEPVAVKAPVLSPAKQLSDWLGALRWRPIGPTSMGGRIVDLAIHPQNPNHFFVATASGGLFKTVNGGVTFEAQFQHEASISIGDICLAPSQPDIVWLGTGENNARNSVSWGDGVYKSTDGGKTWKNMGLNESFQTGRILIHPEDPNIVYVGAVGRLWGNNEQRGIFKTVDGGEHWEKVLYIDDMTGCIELAMHPQDPNTLLAAMYERRRDPFDGGNPVKRYGAGSGLYKSSDAGATWKKLTEGLPTGKLGRIAVDYFQSNPDIIYALLESEEIGKAPPGSHLPALMGIQGNSRDGSATLTTIAKDGAAEKAQLKKGDLVTEIDGKPVKNYRGLVDQIRAHKAGDEVTVKYLRDDKPAETQLTFTARGSSTGRPFGTRLGGQSANIQSKQGPEGFQTGGVYKSTDGGEHWQRVNSLNPRPFYFSQIRVDPSNEQILYVLGISLHQSTDGGKSFRSDAGKRTHPDHHAMWINPANGKHIVLGCDGGLNVTHDQTATWDFIDNLNIGQFYHVGVDTSTPYRVFGGLQDNGSWGGPSATRGSIGPTEHDWFVIGGGDGFLCLADPENPDSIYYESQYGRMGRINLQTGARRQIRAPEKKGEKLRFSWKTPFLLSPHNPRIFFCAGNRVYRSLNQGQELEAISPDLTTTLKGTCTALAQSPRDANVLYAGTDDGNLWMTSNGGERWQKLTVPLIPGPRRVNSIELSRFESGRAYVVYDGHYYDDDKPYVVVTEDQGKTWKSLRQNLPAGTTRVLREDVSNRDLLLLGTETGIWVSLDRGNHWNRLNNNLPHVAVHEIAIHPTAGEIVAATHGRSLWILNITALRQMNPQALKQPVHFFKPPTAVLWQGATGKRFYGYRRFVGTNPPTGSQLTYALQKPVKRLQVTVTDIEGKVVGQFNGSNKAGLHQINWNLRQRKSNGRVKSGTYLVTLNADGKKSAHPLTVIQDPVYSASTLTFDESERLRKLKKVTDD